MSVNRNVTNPPGRLLRDTDRTSAPLEVTNIVPQRSKVDLSEKRAGQVSRPGRTGDELRRFLVKIVRAANDAASYPARHPPCQPQHPPPQQPPAVAPDASRAPTPTRPPIATVDS